MELIIKYRRNNTEKYTTCKPNKSYLAFDVIIKILAETDECELQVKVFKKQVDTMKRKTELEKAKEEYLEQSKGQ